MNGQKKEDRVILIAGYSSLQESAEAHDRIKPLTILGLHAPIRLHLEHDVHEQVLSIVSIRSEAGVPIGKNVIRKACRCIKQNHRENPPKRCHMIVVSGFPDHALAANVADKMLSCIGANRSLVIASEEDLDCGRLLAGIPDVALGQLVIFLQKEMWRRKATEEAAPLRLNYDKLVSLKGGDL
ncbi:MAG TPA: hypothetical protein VJC11_00720 [Patescibacteria group bacterium]|nr:hypothetical protein [Patescibacteria group bacterium]